MQRFGHLILESEREKINEKVKQAFQSIQGVSCL